MTTQEFINKYAVYGDRRDFALQYKTMAEVWDCCNQPDFLFWICENHAPLEKDQSVRLAINFAEMSIANYTADERPRLAIEAAKAWLDNPCEGTMASAWLAADSSAWAAAKAGKAWAAALSAAETARSATESKRTAARSAESVSSLAARSVARSAARSAESDAWSAAWTEARSAQCDMMRQVVKNPFN